MLARASIVCYVAAMNQLSIEKRAQVFACLAEGNSLRATARLTGVCFNAVLQLLPKLSNRRFTRLTNGYSKKAENHEHSVALYAMHYNFCRIHHSLRVTPAMAVGVTDHIWELK